MKLITFKSIAFAAAMTLFSSMSAFALTDEEALAEGMTPIDEYFMANMKAILTPGVSPEGVLEAVNRHRLVIAINKSTKGPDAQTLTMYENGVEILKEKISTGRERQETAVSGKVYLSTTPLGYFRPTKMYTDYLSYTWNAQMPNAVFFIGGIAIHATSPSYYHQLGQRASGGCIRTRIETSKLVREKVMDSGRGSQEGQYKIVKEASGRNRITGNTISVEQIKRYTGELEVPLISSWDTVIIVHE
jgi:hypothetical protein